MLTSTLVTTNALDLVLPNSTAQTVKKQRVSISINENLEYYLDKEIVELKYIESLLIDRLADQDEQVVVLRVDKTVPIEYAVEVMDIAYRNKFKIVLATEQKR
jgi:biopolymer transport protein ExbD